MLFLFVPITDGALYSSMPSFWVFAFFFFFGCFCPSSSLGSLLLGQPAELISSGSQRADVGAADGGLPVDGDLLPVLEEEEGGHGGDAVLPRDVLGVVDVDLGEGELPGEGVLVGQLGVEGEMVLQGPHQSA
uniref:Uncharacterized protein n=1 Tax=Bionectria ochroleuca TaxID=29856 RepID=A0A8H7KDV2_BIOOC